MNNVSAIGLCACLFALGSFWSGLPPAVAAPAPGAVLADWTANGASACQKLRHESMAAASSATPLL